MDRLGKRIADKDILRLIRSYLNAGSMVGGVVLATQEGTPQAGALSPSVWQKLDASIRHRLRAIHLKQWKGGRRADAALRKLGASEIVARRMAGNCKSWWRNSLYLLNTVLTVNYFDKQGLPRLS